MDTRRRLQERFGLSDRDVEVLLSVDSGKDVNYDAVNAAIGAVAYFDQLCAGGPGNSRDPKVVVNWWVLICYFLLINDMLTCGPG